MSFYGNKWFAENAEVVTKSLGTLFLENELAVANFQSTTINDSLLFETVGLELVTEGKIWDTIKSAFSKITGFIKDFIGKLLEIGTNVKNSIVKANFKKKVNNFKEDITEKEKIVEIVQTEKDADEFFNSEENQEKIKQMQERIKNAFDRKDKKSEECFAIAIAPAKVCLVEGKVFKDWIDYTSLYDILNPVDERILKNNLFEYFGVRSDSNNSPVITKRTSKFATDDAQFLNSYEEQEKEYEEVLESIPSMLVFNGKKNFGPLTSEEFNKALQSIEDKCKKKDITAAEIRKNKGVYLDESSLFGDRFEKINKGYVDYCKKLLAQVETYSATIQKAIDKGAFMYDEKFKRKNNDVKIERLDNVAFMKSLTYMGKLCSAVISSLNCLYKKQIQVNSLEMAQTVKVAAFYNSCFI